MSNAAAQYKDIEQLRADLRAVRALDVETDDGMLDQLDAAWSAMTEDERAEANARVVVPSAPATHCENK
jgi:hypothetical protein